MTFAPFASSAGACRWPTPSGVEKNTTSAGSCAAGSSGARMGRSQNPCKCGYSWLIGMPVSVAATSVRIFTPGCRSSSSTIPTPPYPPHPMTLTFNMTCLFLVAIRGQSTTAPPKDKAEAFPGRSPMRFGLSTEGRRKVGWKRKTEKQRP